MNEDHQRRIDPALLERRDVRAMLAGHDGHDIGGLYRLLRDSGWSQRQIAQATGQSQSEVADIIAGRRRKVDSYRLLVRIAEGLDIPRGRMGLAYCTCAYRGGVTVAEPEGAKNMLRRHLLGLGGVTLAGATVEGLGELLAELPGLGPVPLPDRLGHAHVAKIRDLTRSLADACMTFGSDPSVSSPAAEQAMRLLRVSGPEPVKRELKVAVAELHIHAGRAAFDAVLYDRALYHLARALELATEAGDARCQVLALNWAGLTAIEDGHPGDGLKLLQIAQVKAWDIPVDTDRGYSRVALQACGMADSATALVMLGQPEAAYREQGKARELWTPTRADRHGDLDIVAARLELDRGRLNLAEALAVSSVRRWEGISQCDRTRSGVVLATIHVQAGESDGSGLARDAITAVGKLTSVRTRKELAPLADALEARRGGDYAELARRARQVATTRA